MGKLGIINQLIIPFFGYNIKINLDVIIMTWTVFVVLIIFGLFTSRKKDILPRPIQVLGELIVATFYQLTEDALDKEMAKKYSPLICALFMFLLLCNWIGIIPYLEEPTKDLNTPLSLGIMGLVIGTYHADAAASQPRT